jgi:signal transduction histidine kinase
LYELAGYWSNKHQLQIQITAEDVLLDEGFSVHLYRIVQEIVHNTIKHAGATVLQIHLIKEEQMLVLYTTDNGKGFHYQKALEKSNGYGLRNLLSRTDVLGGNLSISSREGGGTIYIIRIPLNAS